MCIRLQTWWDTMYIMNNDLLNIMYTLYMGFKMSQYFYFSFTYYTKYSYYIILPATY